MSANKFVEHQINFLPCPSKKKLQCTGQIRMNKWLRCLQPSDQSNAFKIRADIFFPSSITWYHWPTFLFVTWWWGDHRGCAWESFVDKLGWARFHVGSGIFSSLSNTGMKSLEALNWGLPLHKRKIFFEWILPIWSTKWSLFTKLFAQMGCKSRDESNDAN